MAEAKAKLGINYAKLMPLLVAGLIVAAFFIGNLSAKVAYLEKGGGSGNSKPVVQGVATGQPQQIPTQAPVVLDKEKMGELADGEHVFGNKDTKLAIVEFSDFQCPFCKSFFDNTLPQVRKDYIDTGKIKLVYRHFPLTSIHPYAMGAALASECASEQGKFEDYHDTLFKNQTALAISDLKKYAVDLGLSTAKFNSCLDDEKYKDKVEADSKLATENGINGTPGFFVNGEMISGAQPFEVFKSAIEEALKNS